MAMDVADDADAPSETEADFANQATAPLRYKNAYEDQVILQEMMQLITTQLNE